MSGTYDQCGLILKGEFFFIHAHFLRSFVLVASDFFMQTHHLVQKHWMRTMSLQRWKLNVKKVAMSHTQHSVPRKWLCWLKLSRTAESSFYKHTFTHTQFRHTHTNNFFQVSPLMNHPAAKWLALCVHNVHLGPAIWPPNA